jgi:putative phosphoesterase
MRLGIISDTHGLLRPEAVAALRGVDAILHAGDVGDPKVLEELRALAPVIAVRGNIDVEPWAEALPERASADFAGLHFVIRHRAQDFTDADRRAADVIVMGHSHKPVVLEHDDVLEVNPGSAGPRRFSLPICLAVMTLGQGKPRVDIVTLVASSR